MSLLKPTVQTPFHIDFAWWERNDRDWRVFLRSLLCPEHQQLLAELPEDATIDSIDPRTGEVQPVNGIQHALMNHCALQPDFVGEHTTVVEAVFRVFLVNGNQAMSAEELSRKLNRPAQILLRTLTGPRVYRGLRPVGAVMPEKSADVVAATEA
jgi:hypothetical protein